jgi:hypothetical protein
MKNPVRVIPTAAMAGAVMAAAAIAPAAAAKPAPFKQTNIHFETNASACDMGIQISFDTDGITEGEVESPYGQEVFSMRAVYGQEGTHDLTELFQERVEPPITDLEQALGCEPSEDAISLAELLANWPAGLYEFEGESGGIEFEGAARLTYRVPAGPEITAPGDGDVVAHDVNLLIRWNKVTTPILPSLGPVEIVGYHVVVVDITSPELAPGRTKTSLNADLAKGETTFLVPKQYLEPNRIYEFEVLATEKGGNQTITEGGVFCTRPMAAADCEAP